MRSERTENGDDRMYGRFVAAPPAGTDSAILRNHTDRLDPRNAKCLLCHAIRKSPKTRIATRHARQWFLLDDRDRPARHSVVTATKTTRRQVLRGRGPNEL